jgi:hypothetical protein
MPVIPYTLSDAGHWREFAPHTTFGPGQPGLGEPMKRSTRITLAVIAAIIAIFFYMSTAHATQECTVCVEFNGRSNCATAAGSTAAEATQTAHNTACGPVVSGMNETIACGNQAPVSVACKGRSGS